jgi:tRNA modification GTPase
MFSLDDAIVAVATPPGRGGIGVVRISGESALATAAAILERSDRLEPRLATFTRVKADADVVDEVVATYFPAPHSYTGQDVVEISAHGSPVVLQTIVRAIIQAGARLAQPGEFTLRAFLNGKRDLVQAEAVADLIDAVTPAQARIAFDQLEGTLTRRIRGIDGELYDLIARLEASLDFPDEGYHFIESREAAAQLERLSGHLDALLADARRGRMIREGATVVIVGRPNVGKSSIFNALVGADRAIVTAIPGTTRDLVTEKIDLDGIPITLVDTAGWRETLDVVEREGVARGARAREVADLILVVLDNSEGLTAEDELLLAETKSERRVLVANKADCGRMLNGTALQTSMRTGLGLDDLRRAIVCGLTGSDSLRDGAAISNARHIALLEDARVHLRSARHAAETERVPEEFVLSDLQAARSRLDEVVGVRTTDDLLQHIFERFCVGK